MKYTPGPWGICPEIFAKQNGIGIRGCNKKGVNLIAFLWIEDIKDNETKEEQWANARLITAAPEMLKFLKRRKLEVEVFTKEYFEITDLIEKIEG